MPLTGSDAALSAAIKAGMLAVTPAIVEDGPHLAGMCDAIAAAVIAHLVANAVVLPGTFSNAGGAVVGSGVLS